MKKHIKRKDKDIGAALSPEQQQELEIILDRLGVQDPNGASLDSWFQSLCATLNGKEALTVALLDRLSRSPNKVGYRFYRVVADSCRTKTCRKALKQAGYRFRQAGFGEAPEQEEPVEVTLIAPEVKKSMAHVSSVDEHGAWLVTALVVNEWDQRAFIAAILQSPWRCVNLKIAETSQRAYRQFIRELQPRFPGRFLEIPVWHAARVIREVLEDVVQGAGAEHVNRVRKTLAAYDDPARQSYASEALTVLAEPANYLREINTDQLLNQIGTGALLFPQADLTPFWLRMKELNDSVLVVSQAIKKERASDILREAADTLCSGKTRTGWRRFFEEQAVYYKLSGNEAVAEAAWAVASHLGGTDRASANPVIMDIIASSIYQHWREDFKPAEEEPEEPFYRSESGLVLPR
jgi:hypothetical protein